jgi:TolB-like protein
MVENEKIVVYYKKNIFIGGVVMRKMAFCVIALLVRAALYGQQPVVAVAPFDAISGISATEANMITRVFFIRLGNTNRVSLVDRNVVDRVLNEHKFQLGDWSDAQKTAEIGKALNSDWIVRGELEKLGTNIFLTVQFYDLQTFRFMGGGDLRIANIDEAYDKMDPLVDNLVQTIARSGSQGKNTEASAYYGTWLARSGSITSTFIIEANKITYRQSDNYYFIISNCTWTAANNADVNTLVDNPTGFKVSGVVTDIKGWYANIFMPVYLFIHKNDRNKIEFYISPNNKSEMQTDRFGYGFSKVQ